MIRECNPTRRIIILLTILSFALLLGINSHAQTGFTFTTNKDTIAPATIFSTSATGFAPATVKYTTTPSTGFTFSTSKDTTVPATTFTTPAAGFAPATFKETTTSSMTFVKPPTGLSFTTAKDTTATSITFTTPAAGFAPATARETITPSMTFVKPSTGFSLTAGKDNTASAMTFTASPAGFAPATFKETTTSSMTFVKPSTGFSLTTAKDTTAPAITTTTRDSAFNISTFGVKQPSTLSTSGKPAFPGTVSTLAPIGTVAGTIFGQVGPVVVTPQAVRQEPKEIPLEEVPRLPRTIAQEFLESSPADIDDEPVWTNARLGSAYPLYNPAVLGGKEPAYFEFQVLRPVAGQEPNLASALKYEDAGYILVCATQDDYPVSGFATEGTTQTRALWKELADKDTQSAKIFRYDDILVVAEAEDRKLAQIGPDPVKFCCDIKLSESFSQGQTFEAEVDEKGIITESIRPEIKGLPYEWMQFKQDYLENDLFIRAREIRRQEAVLDWAIVLERELPVLDISQGTTILRGQKVRNFSLTDPIAEIQVLDSGLGVMPQVDEGGSILTVETEDGRRVDYLIGIIDEDVQRRYLGSWGSWHYYWAGSWSDQRRYGQESCCGCVTGCGPVAWAMLYGWWDKKGWSNLIAGGEAPLYLNDYVRDCILDVRDYCDTYCISGSGATNPWDMHDGYKWARDRYNAGHISGYSVSSKWTFPCFYSTSCREKARNCIRDNGRPAIIGIGCTSAHYCLAYGYAWRKKKWLGITIAYSRWFRVNMGHQNNSGTWKKAKVWFGQKALFW